MLMLKQNFIKSVLWDKVSQQSTGTLIFEDNQISLNTLYSRWKKAHKTKTSYGMAICLERDADLHMAQLIPLPLTVSCFSKIQIGFTFLVPADPGSPGKKANKQVCVCVSMHNDVNATSATHITTGTYK